MIRVIYVIVQKSVDATKLIEDHFAKINLLLEKRKEELVEQVESYFLDQCRFSLPSLPSI